jgi:DnaJ-class molecular chaperone
MATQSEDPYKELGVSKTATQDEIKNAYRKLAKKFHPDLNPGNKLAEQKFKKVSGAYELIGTAEARASFDRGETAKAEQSTRRGPGGGAYAGAYGGPFYQETQQNGGRYSNRFEGDFNADDLFENLFRSARQQPGGNSQQRNPHSPSSPNSPNSEDQLYRMDVSFRDAILGAEKEITLPTGKKLRVKIPAGVESGKRLRMRAADGGDVYIEMNVQSSEQFRRVDKNIEVEAAVGIADAVLGGEIEVPTVDGVVKVSVPAGVSTGAKLRIKGKGVRLSEGSGDEIVSLKVMLPREGDPSFKDLQELIRKWRGAHVGS